MPPLKVLPWAPTKSKLVRMYSYYKRYKVIEDINDIIRQNRNISKENPVLHKTLYKSEFETLIKKLDYPKGYEKFFRD